MFFVSFCKFCTRFLLFSVLFHFAFLIANPDLRIIALSRFCLSVGLSVHNVIFLLLKIFLLVLLQTKYVPSPNVFLLFLLLGGKLYTVPSTKQYQLVLTQYHKVTASIVMYWPSTIKYQLVSLYNSSSHNAELSQLDNFCFYDSFNESRTLCIVYYIYIIYLV